MKKCLLVSALVALLSPSALFADKFDAPASILAGMAQAAGQPEARSGEVRALQPVISLDSKVSVIVTFADGFDVNSLVADGYDVQAQTSDMAVVNVLASELNVLAEREYVGRVSLGYQLRELLLNARAEGKVDDVQTGASGLDKKYDGSGIICGLMDGGFDVNHVNFLDDAGEPRTKILWRITGSNGAVETYDTPSKIKGFKTDKSDGSHGTHVLGIMSGSYNGTADKVATMSNGSVVVRRNRPVPYYGVATGAELAVCCGTLQSNNISIAAGKIADFAKSQGKPAVMNLSLGHNIGPHDGTTDQARFLAEKGKEMIICVSAGNEGQKNVSLHKDFVAGNLTVSTTVGKSAAATGVIDIWGNDDTPFKVTFVGIDKTNGEIKYAHKIDGPTDGDVFLTGTYYTAAGYIHEAGFDPVFGEKGAIIYTAGVNTNNNRYNFYCNIQTLSGRISANVVPGFIVEGVAGKSADLYCVGNYGMLSNGINGYSDGNPTQSINDMACGDNVIVVGAYAASNDIPAIGGGGSYGIEIGSIAPFSSYGKTFQGRQLPDISAPGLGVISSYSHYYMQGADTSIASAVLSKNNRNNYWAEMSGTSMSSPFVAGVVALWLQADPTLTVDEVKQIMKETAVNDKFTAVDPHRWGYGKIDALAGIKKILGISAIADVAVDGDDLLISQIDGGRTVDVFSAGASKVEVQLYTVGGAMAASASADGDSVQLSAENLAPGVYIVRAGDGSRTATRKIVL